MTLFSELLFRARRRLMHMDDAAVVSFPKAGRTWLHVMLDNAGVFVRYRHCGAGHNRALHFEELALDPDLDGSRVLLLTRDPRDTAVSGYYAKRAKYKGSLADFIRDPRHGIEKVACYNLMWAERAGVTISYEDLHTDCLGALTRATSFLARRDLPRSRLERAVQFGRFDNMREMETSGKGRQLYGDALGRNTAVATKTRRGKTGGWVDEFTAEDATFAEEILARYDYAKRLANLVAAADRHRRP
jgi:hypothetical protein